jgi:hypothetical protein
MAGEDSLVVDREALDLDAVVYDREHRRLVAGERDVADGVLEQLTHPSGGAEWLHGGRGVELVAGTSHDDFAELHGHRISVGVVADARPADGGLTTRSVGALPAASSRERDRIPALIASPPSAA